MHLNYVTLTQGLHVMSSLPFLLRIYYLLKFLYIEEESGCEVKLIKQICGFNLVDESTVSPSGLDVDSDFCALACSFDNVINE